MRPHSLTALLLVAALAGLAFATVSTYDFTAHLDRQVHGIHCSFLPGLSPTETGNTGCHVTLMSPYSSVLRASIWGGIPISLPAMSVFSFLAFFAIWLVLRDHERDPRATAFTLLATALPASMSVVMGYISLSQLHAACKLCIGIYTSSVIAFIAALLLFLRARNTRTTGGATPVDFGALSLAFGVGVLFVAVPVSTYAASAPDFSRYVGRCGKLAQPDAGQVLVPIGAQDRPLSMIEVLDPLCPSCRGFEDRFSRMDASLELSRRALLFPLDNTCNWMVGDSIHPGACSVSEAMLCAGARAGEVLEWSYQNQEAIIEATKTDPKAAARMVSAHFPDLASCVGSASVRAKLNLSLRYAVKNHLQVLTPQVFVAGVRLCDEDTDLGLDFALPHLIAYARANPATGQAPSGH
ncbi:MAG: vitamin K epoxide reductase family protein [Polyangiales bacterium]